MNLNPNERYLDEILENTFVMTVGHWNKLLREISPSPALYLSGFVVCFVFFFFFKNWLDKHLSGVV